MTWGPRSPAQANKTRAIFLSAFYWPSFPRWSISIFLPGICLRLQTTACRRCDDLIAPTPTPNGFITVVYKWTRECAPIHQRHIKISRFKSSLEHKRTDWWTSWGLPVTEGLSAAAHGTENMITHFLCSIKFFQKYYNTDVYSMSNQVLRKKAVTSQRKIDNPDTAFEGGWSWSITRYQRKRFKMLILVNWNYSS